MSYPPPPQQPGPYGPGQYPPPGQYQPGPYSPGPYPPPGYPPQMGYPPRPRRHGTVLLVTAFVLGGLAAISLFLMLILGHDASTCNSGLGELAQAFDQQTASQCSAVNSAHDVLEVVTVVLGIGCLATAIDYFRR